MYVHLSSEYTVIFLSSRTEEARDVTQQRLLEYQWQTNASLASISTYWFESGDDGEDFKSKRILEAVLHQHRSTLNQNNPQIRFEVEFYTRIVDVLLTWYFRHIHMWINSPVTSYLSSYGYLLQAVNVIGVQQAVCSAYYNIICLSYKENLMFANYSYSAVSSYKSYLQSLNALDLRHESVVSEKENDIFERVFPNLLECHREIIADLSFTVSSQDKEQCNYARKNETKFSDLDVLVNEKHAQLVANTKEKMTDILSESRRTYLLAFYINIGFAVYCVLVLFLRLLCVRKSRSSRQKRSQQTVHDCTTLDDVTREWDDDVKAETGASMCHVTVNERPIVYDYLQTQTEDPLAPFIKVASV